MLFAPFLTCPLRGAECAASAKVRFSLTVVFRFACLATWWRGLFEQCVVDFCSVPRGGVKKKKIGRGPIEQCVEDHCPASRGGVEKKRERKNRSRTVRAVCRGLLLCATRWHKKKSVEDRSSSVSETSALCHEVDGKEKREIGRGPIELWVEYFCSVPRGGVEKNKQKKKQNKTKGKHEISGRGPIGRCVEKFCPVPRGGVERKTKNRSGTTCAMSFLFALCRVVA